MRYRPRFLNSHSPDTLMLDTTTIYRSIRRINGGYSALDAGLVLDAGRGLELHALAFSDGDPRDDTLPRMLAIDLVRSDRVVASYEGAFGGPLEPTSGSIGYDRLLGIIAGLEDAYRSRV